MELDRVAPLEDAARSIDGALDELQAVASAARHGDQLAAAIVDAHAAGLRRLVELAERPEAISADPELAELLWVQGTRADDGAVGAMAGRIDALRSSIEQSGVPGLLNAADRLISDLLELYGWALGRAIEVLDQTDQGAALERALEDPVIGALLLAHGMSPVPLAERVRHVLAACATTLGDQAGQVELVDADDETGVVSLVVTGGDDKQRWRTRLAVERAVRDLVPDVVQLHIEGADAEPRGTPSPTIIPVTSIGRRRTSTWAEVPALGALAEGEVLRLRHGGVALVACRVGTDLFVARDPFTTNSLRLVSTAPPVVEAADGTCFAFSDPLPTHRAGDVIEVLL